VFYAYWSVKGGSGTTVVAACHALLLARCGRDPVMLVDLAGDLAAALGVPERCDAGVCEWLAGGGRGGLHELATPVDASLSLVSRGASRLCDGGDHGGDLLAAALAQEASVVVDCGVPSSGVARAVAAAADRSLLVVRPCYLALRRAVAAPVRPSAVVLVTEPERALGRRDIEEVLGVPVAVEVPLDARIARAVDAGLLASRLPRVFDRAFWQAVAA
jgi:MinD-like ATPase involved in chromosome partitioning or flagellar assembly